MKALKKIHNDSWEEVFNTALDEAAKEAAKYMLECLKQWTGTIPVGFSNVVEAHLKMLRDMGVTITVEKKTDTEFVYRVLNCPIASVVDISPDACYCEIKWVEKLLSIAIGKKVSNTAPMRVASGNPYCQHVITLDNQKVIER
jgi:predicted ArsR family transcriptional regulator